MEFRFPDGMLLGVASAAAQIEGGEVNHSWNAWADAGHIRDGSTPRRANQHFRLWREDIDLMRDMGLQVYRLGLEWARLEPEPGRFDEAAVAYYRELLAYIRACGIRPLVTLHHFSNPMWFQRMGSFEKPQNAEIFLRYVDFAVRAFGGLASEYITINEPNVYAIQGYVGGGWPPGTRFAAGKALRVMSVLAGCHILAYRHIHAVRQEMGFADTQVSFAHHMRVFTPQNPQNPWHRLATRLVRHLFQGALTKACLTGRFPVPLRNMYKCAPGAYADFLALNYYTRSTVSGLADGMADGVPKNDLGWEIYPDGIVQCARQMHAVLPRPVYVTENGTCDNTDAFRARYIAEHLAALCGSELPVQRYYHWSFTDNFEWLEGESARFGLVHVDYPTQVRTVKRSGAFFSELIGAGGLTQDIYSGYVAEEKYHK